MLLISDFERFFHDMVYMENYCHLETHLCMHEMKIYLQTLKSNEVVLGCPSLHV